jgi:hypothetical protein
MNTGMSVAMLISALNGVSYDPDNKYSNSNLTLGEICRTANINRYAAKRQLKAWAKRNKHQL